MRTWEEFIKFDSGLTVGTHCVTLKVADAGRRALVEITSTGKVWVLFQPFSPNSRASWQLVVGDTFTDKFRSVPEWLTDAPALMHLFDNPVAVIDKPTKPLLNMDVSALELRAAAHAAAHVTDLMRALARLLAAADACPDFPLSPRERAREVLNKINGD